MKTIACIYTAGGNLPDIISSKINAAIGENKYHHITESGLIGDVIAADGMTEEITERIYHLFDAAMTTHPDLVLMTCSSVGDAVDSYAAAHPDYPILRVDYPMAKIAAETGKKVAVLATLGTTVAPSVRLIERLAKEFGRDVEIVSAVAGDAFKKLISDNKEGATEEVVKTVKEKCLDCDIVVLAQASMALFGEALAATLPKETKVLDSPSTCAEYLKTYFD